MSRIARGLEHSLASAHNPGLAKQRVEDIKTLRAFPDRFGALALHKFVVAYPEASRKLINLALISSDLEYLMSGADSGVFRRGDDVLKVVRSSASLSEQAKVEEAARRRASFSSLSSYLGDFVVEQDVIVEQHPLNPSWRAVQTVQPFIPFEGIDLWSVDNPEVNVERVAEAAQHHSGLVDALTDFVERSKRYHDDTGLFPDTNGTDNLVIGNVGGVQELTLLDTVPIGQEHPGVQIIINGQLDSLREALLEVA